MPAQPTGDNHYLKDTQMSETTRHNEISQAAVPLDGKVRQQKGGQKGGSMGKRMVLLMPMDLGIADGLDLRSTDGRMSVLEAVAVAVAKGRTSALAATTLAGIVKQAREEAEAGWEKLATKQAEVIESMRRGVDPR